MTKIGKINGGRSANRFAGCTTAEDMANKATKNETVGVYKYRYGTQVEVRRVNGFGRMIRVVTAEVIED